MILARLTFLNRMPVGLTKRSYFGGFRTNPSPTKVALVIIRFHAFFFRFPVLITLNISASEMLGTFGIGTVHFPAFSFRFCLIVLLSTFALDTPSRSSKNAGTAPSGVASLSACLLSRS